VPIFGGRRQRRGEEGSRTKSDTSWSFPTYPGKSKGKSRDRQKGGRAADRRCLTCEKEQKELEDDLFKTQKRKY